MYLSVLLSLLRLDSQPLLFTLAWPCLELSKQSYFTKGTLANGKQKSGRQEEGKKEEKERTLLVSFIPRSQFDLKSCFHVYLHMSVRGSVHARSGACGGQKRASDLPGTVVTSGFDALGSSVRAAIATMEPSLQSLAAKNKVTI